MWRARRRPGRRGAPARVRPQPPTCGRWPLRSATVPTRRVRVSRPSHPAVAATKKAGASAAARARSRNATRWRSTRTASVTSSRSRRWRASSACTTGCATTRSSAAGWVVSTPSWLTTWWSAASYARRAHQAASCGVPLCLHRIAKATAAPASSAAACSGTHRPSSSCGINARHASSIDCSPGLVFCRPQGRPTADPKWISMRSSLPVSSSLRMRHTQGTGAPRMSRQSPPCDPAGASRASLPDGRRRIRVSPWLPPTPATPQ